VIANFKRQMEMAERRFAEHTAQREERAENLKTLGAGGDWRKVDDPERILNRLHSLGMVDEAREMAAAMVTGGTLLGTVPVSSGSDAAPRGEVTAGPANFLERLIGEDNLLNSQFLVRGAMATRAVARIVIRGASGQAIGFGTGFMVSPRLLMTNNHVLDTSQAARFSIAQFNYYDSLSGQPAPAISFDLQPELFFVTNEHLDFTLVAVQERNEQGQRVADQGWIHLISETGKSIVGESVNIIQHPAGGRQLVALRQNHISDVLPDFLHYTADTDRGASGGPVCNDQWELTALHHAGVPKRDPGGRILLVSGMPWDGNADRVDHIDWIANEGVRVSRITEYMEQGQGSLSAAQQALYQQVFAPAPELLGESSGPARAMSSAALPAVGLTAAGLPAGQPPRIDDQGNVVWTIPIEVRIGLASVAAALPASGGGTALTPAGPLAAVVPAETQEESPALRAALERVQEAAARPYYEADRDAADRAGYYEGIDLGRPAERLFRDLHNLVKDSHGTVVSYDSARLNYLYPWVDLHELGASGRELRSIYSGTSFRAEEIIREEFAIERRRQQQLQEMLAGESELSEARMEALLDALEAQSPFNCEHAVPQSWFGKQQPMRGDLHHLFTCEWGCNSFRNNIAYYQFPPEEEAFRDACGQRDTARTKFEPVAGKGPVARATLYFLLRYPGLIGDEMRELGRDRLPILLQWNDRNPVTTYERHRNAAIFEIQGNRNPLIDFPDWAWKVAFAAGFGVV
jgi:endonuclease G, mitochondrial